MSVAGTEAFIARTNSLRRSVAQQLDRALGAGSHQDSDLIVCGELRFGGGNLLAEAPTQRDDKRSRRQAKVPHPLAFKGSAASDGQIEKQRALELRAGGAANRARGAPRTPAGLRENPPLHKR